MVNVAETYGNTQGGISTTPKPIGRKIIYDVVGANVKLMGSLFTINKINLNIFNTYVYGVHSNGVDVLLFQCKAGKERDLLKKIAEKADGHK